jgi:hypothetical protein
MTTREWEEEHEAYKAYTRHLSTCDACDNPDDDDYICPDGLKLKATWLGAPKET